MSTDRTPELTERDRQILTDLYRSRNMSVGNLWVLRDRRAR